MINDKLIQIILNDITNNYKCDRCIVANIHSLAYSDYDVYTKVFSVCSEYLMNDTSSVKHIIKNKSIEILKLEHQYYKNDILIVPGDSPFFPEKCRAHLKNIGVKNIINILIKYQDIILGILSLQYLNDSVFKSFDDLKEEDIIYLKNQASRIAKYL